MKIEAHHHLDPLFLLCLILVTSLSLNSIFSADAHAAEDQTYTVSFPNVKADSGEVIAEFQIRTTAAAFVGILNLPVGWYLDINNDPSGKPK